MLTLITGILTSRLTFPSFFIRACLHSMNFAITLKSGKAAFDSKAIDRYGLVLKNARNEKESAVYCADEMDLKIIIVVAGKDFQLIRKVLDNAIKHLPNYRITCIEIIVPDHLINDEHLLSLATSDKRI